MRKHLLIIILAAVFMGCKSDKNSEDNNFSLVKAGQTMPQFTINTADGASFDSQRDIPAGKRAFIYFFASYCEDCHKATPNVIELWKQVGTQNDLVFMCIARGGGSATEDAAVAYWNSVSANAGLTFDQMPTLYYDKERAVFNKFASQNVPRYYIVGKDGKITWESEGNFTADALNKHLNAAK